MANETELKLSKSMSAVFYDVEESVRSEVASIRGQTDQIKSLLEDAITSLHDAFGSIHESTNEQMKTMTALMMQVVGADDEQNIFQQAESASLILTDLVETLLLSSKNNLRALTTMDTVRNRLDKLINMERKQSDLIQQLLGSIEGDSVPADTVRRVGEELRDLQLLQAKYGNETMAMFKNTHRLIDEIASKDMDEVFASKAKVEKIVQHFFDINSFVSERRSSVSQINGDIRQHLGTAIRALQFEDISRQSLGYTDRHLDRMEGMLTILTDGLRNIEANENLTLEEYTHQVEMIHGTMLDYHRALQLEENNPISQENMDEGDVDLF
ncbi:hypothetical protein FE236_00235 [Mariprofundus erugo]|uniref:Chemotaxis protein n=1 Tax=Mariprofundus erugo TaxID=2528639 RepID=A0A5R9GMW1_9PROT|nr:hypothetical protein [Mariprofundus erugo]TLS66289.1 hypothetical protein FEF65_10775 [Mariprofundus erugo]TLS78222.1 hypothetical protein FE236_00235 [Mariprofundus erugo]